MDYQNQELVLSVLDEAVIMSISQDAPVVETPQENLIQHFDLSTHSHIKLCVLMKNDNLNNVPQEYVFTKDFGRADSSEPWKDHSSILLGRQNLQRNKQQKSLVDINIRHNNRVSHHHCKLILTDGWKRPARLSVEFVEFLKIASRKQSEWYRLPKDLYKMIWSFFDIRPKFYIQDLGSKFGTFLKLRSKQIITEDCVFSVGQYSLIKVVKIEKDIHIHKLKNFEEKWESVGLKQINTLDQDQMQLQSNATFSYLIICVEDYKQKSRQNYVALCMSHLQTAIVLGRHLNNHIVIKHEEVSRRHCRILFQVGRWMIDDGSSDSDRSRNGTWLDVRSTEDIRLLRQSQPRQILSNQEIKIGETYLRFEVNHN